MSERYEGDYGCNVSEGERCGNVATKVYREPFTSLQVAVLACDGCGDALRQMDYTFDAGATIQLCRDVEREAEVLA